MATWRRWTMLGILMLGAIPAAQPQAQRPLPPIAPAATPPPPNPGSAVQLDVMVLDGAGKPVPGLTRGDFSVLDDKQPRTITGFVPANAGEPPTEVVLLLDAVNTGFSTVSYARDQITHYLRANEGKLPVPVSVAVFTDSGVSMLNSPSEDGNAIAAQLAGNNTGLRTIRRSMGFYGASDRLGISLHGLSTLSDYERNRPGRKLVVWIGPGWPYLSGPGVQLSSAAQRSLFHSIVNLSTALREARITLDSVDPLGTADAAGFRTSYYQVFLKPVRDASHAQAGNLALQVLAEQSGGRAFNSNNDIGREIAACVGEAGGLYSVSFRGAVAEGEGEYHAIEVKLDKPGLKVRTRDGYYAAPATALPR